MLHQIGCPLEVKELTDTGTFEGMASVYGNVDLGGDIVIPGAFKEFVATKDGSVRILNGHSSREPIGKGKVTDTHLGLAIKGQLNLQVSRARDVHALMKDGIIDGLSIGYDILPNGFKIREDGVRELSGLKLWEVSTTVFPMNQEALIGNVKEIQRVKSVRELEHLLRESTGISKTQAAKFAGDIWKTLTGQREAGSGNEEDEQLRKMLGFLNQFTTT